MLDISLKGSPLTPFSVEVERGRLRAFAKATGQENPVYWDETAAHARGLPSLPLPPTFLFCLEMESPNPMEVFERLHINHAHVLHGEQHFVYHRLAFAGETLRFKPRIADVYERKSGALGFIAWETRVEGSDGKAVADLRSVMVVRPPRPTQVRANPGCAVLQRGGALPGLIEGPITRHTLGVYAGASGDYNPLHIDVDYAREAGMPDVFAHGMLSAAYLARVLTRQVDPSALRRLGVRFVSITHIGDEVHCQAQVTGEFVENGEPCVSLALTARNQAGDTKLTGTAVVSAVGQNFP